MVVWVWSVRGAALAGFWGGLRPHPTPFLCLAKEKGEKGDQAAPVPAAGFLCFSKVRGRHGMARRLRRRGGRGGQRPKRLSAPCSARHIRGLGGLRQTATAPVKLGRRVELRHTRLCAIYGAFGPLSCVWLSVAEPTVTMFVCDNSGMCLRKYLILIKFAQHNKWHRVC